MKQTNKKYISKEMAMMAAITTESMLLHEGYDAMLYWHAPFKHYVILIEYLNDNPVEKHPNYSCSRWRAEQEVNGGLKETVLYFEY